jgi:antitoxin VapB
MATTRVFWSGKSQAVRLPKQFRLKGKEVEIFRRGVLANLPDDFLSEDRQDAPPQRRDG